jgi:hypothetical protein
MIITIVIFYYFIIIIIITVVVVVVVLFDKWDQKPVKDESRSLSSAQNSLCVFYVLNKHNHS